MGGIVSSSVRPEPPKLLIGRTQPTSIELLWDLNHDIYSTDEDSIESANTEIHVRREKEKGMIDVFCVSGSSLEDRNLDPEASYSYEIKLQSMGRETPWSNPVKVSSENRATNVLHEAVEADDASKTLSVLQNPPFRANVYEGYKTYYQEQLCKEGDTRSLTLDKVCGLIDKENRIQGIRSINEAVETKDPEKVWKALNMHGLNLTCLRKKYKDDYRKALHAQKSESSESLSLNDIQRTVLRINEENAILAINTAITQGSHELIVSLRDDDSPVWCNVNEEYSQEYFMILREEREEQKKMGKSGIPFTQEEIQLFVENVNGNIILLRLNKLLEEKSTNVDGVMKYLKTLSTTKNLRGLQEDNKREYATLLKERKDMMEPISEDSKNQKGGTSNDRTPMNDREGRLDYEKIQYTIQIANREKTYIALNDRPDEQEKWLRTTGITDVVEVYMPHYKNELNKRKREKTGEKKSESYNWYNTRLTKREIEETLKDVNEHRAVVKVLRSSNETVLKEAMNSKFLKIPGINKTHFKAYLKLLMESKEEECVNKEVAEDKESVTKKDIQACIENIKKVVKCDNVLHKIDDLLKTKRLEGNEKKLYKELSNLKKIKCFKGSLIETEQLCYFDLLVAAKGKKMKEPKVSQDDPFQQSLTHKEIDQLLQEHRAVKDIHDKLNEKEKKKERLEALKAKIKELKELSTVKDIDDKLKEIEKEKERLEARKSKIMELKEHWAVKDIHDKLKEIEKEKESLEALKAKIMELKETEEQWFKALKSPTLKLDFIDDPLEDIYRKLFKDEWDAKRKLQNSPKGYEQYLDRDEIQDAIKIANAVQDIHDKLKEKKEKWLKALKSPTLKLKNIDDTCVEGYRKLFEDEWGAKRKPQVSNNGDKEDQVNSVVIQKNEESSSHQNGLKEYERYLDRDEIQGVIKMHSAVIAINKVLEKYIWLKKKDNERIENESKGQSDEIQLQLQPQLQLAEDARLVDFEKEALQTLSNKDAQLLQGIIVHQQEQVYLKRLVEHRKQKTVPKKDRKPVPIECQDMSFEERLTKKEIEKVFLEWKCFEKFAHNLLSPDTSDQQCLTELNNLLPEDQNGQRMAKDMAQFRYRMTDYIKGKFEREGEDEEELWGQNFLQLATYFKKTETAIEIAQRVPGLITEDIGRSKNNKLAYTGLTILHVAVAYGQCKLVKELLDKINTWENLCNEEMDKRTNGTVFMGQLPLHIAVLSYINDNNKDDTFRDKENRFVKVLKILVESDRLHCKLDARNGKGDTVFHSIMRFVKCFPRDEPRAVDMMSYLEKMIDEAKPKMEFKKNFFFVRNNENKTALQLASEFGHAELFKYFIKVQGAYHMVLPHDDIYEISRLDVTEFDKVSLVRAYFESEGEEDTARSDSAIFEQQSIAEIVCCQPLQIGVKLVRSHVFEEIISRKRYLCLWYYSIFFVLHLFFTVLFCVYAVARAETDRGNPWSDTFLKLCYWLTLLCSLLYLVQELILRSFLARQRFAWKAVHHNCVYRSLMALFGTFLLCDFIMYSIPSPFQYKSFCLICAVVVGTWALMFFLRMCPYFSVFVVHINEGFLTAILPFAVLILLQVFVFSVGMYSSFQYPEYADNNIVVDQFETYGKSLLTMGKLMIGLTEVENLLDSRDDLMVIILFIAFLTVTFLLLINALIGVMTNRFVDNHSNKRMIWRLQRLSVIIFFEGWFLGIKRLSQSPFVEMAGRRMNTRKAKRYGIRYVMSYRKAYSMMPDNRVNNEHAL